MAWGAYQKRTCHNKQLTSPQRVYIIDERTRHSAVRTHRARVRFKVIHRAPFLHNRHPSRDPKCYQKAGYIKLSRKKVISPQCVGFTHYRAQYFWDNQTGAPKQSKVVSIPQIRPALRCRFAGSERRGLLPYGTTPKTSPMAGRRP